MKTCPGRLLPFVLLFAGAFLCPTGRAQVLLDDDFTGATGGGTALNATVTSVTNWVRYGGGNTTTLSVVDYTGGAGTPDALSLTGNSTATFRGVRGMLTTPDTLLIGETITLTLDFRMTTSANNTQGFRFGLGTDTNTYRFGFGSGTTTGSVLQRADAVDGIQGAATTFTPVSGTGIAFNINNSTSHTFSLSLTRTGANSIFLEGMVDGANLYQATDSAATDFGFDRMLFGAGGGTLGFNVDNVLVTTIPEPSTYALIGLGMGALWILRRRSALS